MDARRWASASEVPELAHVRFVPFRERAGDDASCANLYAPQEPRILGASHAFVAAGRFSFQASLARRPRNGATRGCCSSRSRRRHDSGDRRCQYDSVHPAPCRGDELTVRGSSGHRFGCAWWCAARQLPSGRARWSATRTSCARFRRWRGTGSSCWRCPRRLPNRWSGRCRIGWQTGVSRRTLARETGRVPPGGEHVPVDVPVARRALGLVLGTIGLAAVLLRNVLERRKNWRCCAPWATAAARLWSSSPGEHPVDGHRRRTAARRLGPDRHRAGHRGPGGSFPLAAAGATWRAVLVAGVLSSLAVATAVRRMPLLAALRSE